jgi:hypothetical protein
MYPVISQGTAGLAFIVRPRRMNGFIEEITSSQISPKII